MVRLEIPYKFPSYNEYSNKQRECKYAGAQMKKQVQEDIGWYIKKLPEFKKPVRIAFTWIEGNRRRDYDNISSGKKFILDAMVQQGKLKDDNRNYVIGYAEEFGYIKDVWKVILNIQEVQPGEETDQLLEGRLLANCFLQARSDNLDAWARKNEEAEI